MQIAMDGAQAAFYGAIQEIGVVLDRVGNHPILKRKTLTTQVKIWHQCAQAVYQVFASRLPDAAENLIDNLSTIVGVLLEIDAANSDLIRAGGVVSLSKCQMDDAIFAIDAMNDEIFDQYDLPSLKLFDARALDRCAQNMTAFRRFLEIHDFQCQRWRQEPVILLPRFKAIRAALFPPFFAEFGEKSLLQPLFASGRGPFSQQAAQITRAPTLVAYEGVLQTC